MYSRVTTFLTARTRSTPPSTTPRRRPRASPNMVTTSSSSESSGFSSRHSDNTLSTSKPSVGESLPYFFSRTKYIRLEKTQYKCVVNFLLNFIDFVANGGKHKLSCCSKNSQQLRIIETWNTLVEKNCSPRRKHIKTNIKASENIPLDIILVSLDWKQSSFGFSILGALYFVFLLIH